MNLIRSALRDQVHLRSSRTSLIDTGVRCGHAKFLDRIERRAQGAGKGEAFQLIVIVHAVQSDVRLVASSAIDRSAAAVLIQIDLTAVCHGHYAWLKTQNCGRVSPFKRKR